MEELRRQLELQEEENRRLKAKFALENKRLRDSLGTLTQELNEIQARILQQTKHSLKHEDVQISPEKGSLPDVVLLPSSRSQVDTSTQCDVVAVSVAHSSTQCDLREEDAEYAPIPAATMSRSHEVQTPLVEVTPLITSSSSSLLGNRTPVATDNCHTGTGSWKDGLVQSPTNRKNLAGSLEDLEVPTLAKEADRLLSVITRLRMERATPLKAAPVL